MGRKQENRTKQNLLTSKQFQDSKLLKEKKIIISDSHYSDTLQSHFYNGQGQDPERTLTALVLFVLTK